MRKVRARHGDYFFGFNPAISDEAAKRIRAQIRSWRLHLRSGWSLKELAQEVNMTVRGWINYYGGSTRRRCVRASTASMTTCVVGRAEVQAVPGQVEAGAGGVAEG